jgi:hypothetical protein
MFFHIHVPSPSSTSESTSASTIAPLNQDSQLKIITSQSQISRDPGQFPGQFSPNLNNRPIPQLKIEVASSNHKHRTHNKLRVEDGCRRVRRQNGYGQRCLSARDMVVSRIERSGGWRVREIALGSQSPSPHPSSRCPTRASCRDITTHPRERLFLHPATTQAPSGRRMIPFCATPPVFEIFSLFVLCMILTDRQFAVSFLPATH